jgi:hypothetical protein
MDSWNGAGVDERFGRLSMFQALADHAVEDRGNLCSECSTIISKC